MSKSKVDSKKPKHSLCRLTKKQILTILQYHKDERLNASEVHRHFANDIPGYAGIKLRTVQDYVKLSKDNVWYSHLLSVAEWNPHSKTVCHLPAHL